MEYLPYALLAFIAVLFLAQARVLLGARRMRGREAPDYHELMAPGQAEQGALLFYFFSPHCGPCRAMAPLVDRLAEETGRLIKVDVAQHLEAARRFGVAATPTLVLVRDGRIEQVLLGSQSEKRLRRLLEP